MAEEKAGTEKGEEKVEPSPEERTHDRFSEYRKDIADGKSVFTEDEVEALATTADQREEAAAKAEKEAEEQAAKEAKAEAGEEVSAKEGEEEGDEEAEEEAAAAGEGEKAEAAKASEEKGEGDDITVELPGRNDGETVEFVVDDQDSADALLRLNKGYLRGEEMNAKEAKVQAAWDEIDEIKEGMATDAVSFIEKELSDVKDRAILVTSLLLDDKVWDAVQESMEDIADPERREVLTLKLDKQRRDVSDVATARLTQKRAAKAAVTKIGDNVRGLVPDGMDAERAVRFQVAAMSVAEDLVGKLKRFELTDSELTDALTKEGLLDRFGIDLVAAPANGKKKAAGSKDGTGKPPAKKPAGKKPAAQSVDGLKKASLRRRSVAGSASSGAGAPAATVKLTKTTSVKDRIKEARKLGLGNILSGKT